MASQRKGLQVMMMQEMAARALSGGLPVNDKLGRGLEGHELALILLQHSLLLLCTPPRDETTAKRRVRKRPAAPSSLGTHPAESRPGALYPPRVELLWPQGRSGLQ